MSQLFNFGDLFAKLKENIVFMLQFVGIIVAVILFAFLLEKLIQRKNGKKEKVLTTRKIAVIGIMSAIASVLMLFEIPLPNIVSFYKLDFSELPILLCAFAYGPMAGVFSVDKVNNVDFIGFSNLHGRIEKQVSSMSTSTCKQISYWKNKIPQILGNK